MLLTLPHPGTDDGRGVADWFAIRVRSNHEYAVEVALAALGVETLVPSYSETVQWSDRLKVITRPIFPGYVLTQLEDTQQQLAPVLETSGVVQVLPSNASPLAVPHDQIETVRRLVDSLLPLLPSDTVVGAPVTVRQGVLSGLTGVIVRQAGRARLVVAVQIFNRAISVELDHAAVRACRA